MANHSSQYRSDILRLAEEGKKYYEIEGILGCSRSVVCYHLSLRQQETASRTKKLNSAEYKLNRSKGILRNRQYVDKYLEGSVCTDCGNSDARVLEFDHVRGDKIGSISHAIRDAWSLEKLKTELLKCEIRCCNCHRIKTTERRIHINNTNIIN